MENTNVLKTALGVGVLGTAAVALGFYYFNENEPEVESELQTIESTTSNVVKESKETASIATDVINEIASKKSQMQSFWESTYKNISQSNDTTTQENNDIISN
tara:strand:- start:306 stop:614 length:309 start_codon:yes stop_codon:yes gene_type:complete